MTKLENMHGPGSPCSARLGRGGEEMSAGESTGAVVRATPIFASGEYLAEMCGVIDRLRAENERLRTALEDTVRHLMIYAQDDGYESNGPQGWISEAPAEVWAALDRGETALKPSERER